MAWFRNIFCREYLGAYIMTIGVIDECRRLGLGTMLLDKTIETL
jgi:ribosomal protein S18 acetylase RimI-like enzyme